MGKGLGPIQRKVIKFLQGREGWSADIETIASDIFDLARPIQKSASAYQSTARALRSLENRGLVFYVAYGRWGITPFDPGPSPEDLTDLSPDEAARLQQSAWLRDRIIAKLKKRGQIATDADLFGLVDGKPDDNRDKRLYGRGANQGFATS